MSDQRDNLTSPGLFPPWLCGDGSNAQRFLFAMAHALDGLLEKQQQAMSAKLPTQGQDPSLIPLQAADRLFVQGPAETNAQIIARMQRARDSWKRAGSRPAVLEQVQAYLTGTQAGVAVDLPECLIVGGYVPASSTDAAVWDTIYNSTPQGGAPAHARIVPSNWDWDGDTTHPTRAWLVLFMHLVSLGRTGAAATVASTGGSGVTGVTSGFATLTGLTGMSTDDVMRYLTISGAATSSNNGTFQIAAVLSNSSVIIANPSAVAADANNGAIAWSVGEYPFIGPGPVWGSPSFVWGAGNAWGLSCSAEIVTSIRNIVKQWKSASTYYPGILISFGGGDSTSGSEFSPNSSIGGGNPDGSDASWALPGYFRSPAFVPSRQLSDPSFNPFTVMCDGTGVSIRCYEKNRS